MSATHALVYTDDDGDVAVAVGTEAECQEWLQPVGDAVQDAVEFDLRIVPLKTFSDMLVMAEEIAENEG